MATGDTVAQVEDSVKRKDTDYLAAVNRGDMATYHKQISGLKSSDFRPLRINMRLFPLAKWKFVLNNLV